MIDVKGISRFVIIGDTKAVDSGVENNFRRQIGEDVVYENMRLSVKTSKRLLSAGGGQTTTITAYVTHGDNNWPAQGVDVGFFAGEDDKDRNYQLSATAAVTDANGMATSTYTTLAQDDNKQIYIHVNANNNDDWIDRRTYIIASNEASLVEGRLTNPFTGIPYPGANVSFFNMDNQHYVMFEETSDEDGNYFIAVMPGRYLICSK
ncbi:MAG: hypothetical protein KGZ79_01775 [Dethiobacter sp.]|nr:hypothetical protein [Dethiobacter sp.]